MLRLSKLTDYAMVVATRLSAAAVRTVPELAAATGVPEPTVAKVLKSLAIAGVVESRRGARGGYRLARPLAEISVVDVIAGIDGPIALTACVDGGTCGHCNCILRGRWDVVNDAIAQALGAISLADMCGERQYALPASAALHVE